MAIRTIRSGGTQHTERSVLQIITDLVTASGVLDLSATNHLLVTAQSPTPTMNLDVAKGDAIIVDPTGNAYPVNVDAVANPTITANASGNPRIDAIVAYIDKSASPNSDSSNVAKIAVVAGTPAASPTAPDDTAIHSSIGSSNPYIRLADVTVVSGASSITSDKIVDKRTAITIRLSSPYFRFSGGKIQFSNDNGVTYKDLGAASLNRDRIKASGNVALTNNTITDMPGATVTLVLAQDSYVDIFGIFDVQATVANAVFKGFLNVDGSDNIDPAFYRSNSNNERMMVPMTWGLALLAGTHTIKLRVQNQTGSGQFDVTQGTTGFTYLVTNQ